jgi:hypothetical protein
VEGCHILQRHISAEREVHVIGVKMDNLKFFRHFDYFVEHHRMMRQGVDAILAEPQRPFASRNQPRFGDRISAGKQRDIMT